EGWVGMVSQGDSPSRRRSWTPSHPNAPPREKEQRAATPASALCGSSLLRRGLLRRPARRRLARRSLARSCALRRCLCGLLRCLAGGLLRRRACRAGFRGAAALPLQFGGQPVDALAELAQVVAGGHAEA